MAVIHRESAAIVRDAGVIAEDNGDPTQFALDRA